MGTGASGCCHFPGLLKTATPCPLAGQSVAVFTPHVRRNVLHLPAHHSTHHDAFHTCSNQGGCISRRVQCCITHQLHYQTGMTLGTLKRSTAVGSSKQKPNRHVNATKMTWACVACVRSMPPPCLKLDFPHKQCAWLVSCKTESHLQMLLPECHPVHCRLDRARARLRA